MDDARIWAFEESLWKADHEHYAESIDPEYVLVVPAPPYIAFGKAAVEVLAQTPRWDSVEFSETQVGRPQEGLITVAYRVNATRGDERYDARCSSVYRRIDHEIWTVVQHQQAPVLAA